MKKIRTDRMTTRERHTHPYLKYSLYARLGWPGAIDLLDNYTITYLGNGYIKIEAIDPTRLVKSNSDNKSLLTHSPEPASQP